MKFFVIYLIVINVIASFIFIYDKIAAQKSTGRVPERTLHLLEMVGGVFSVVVLMHFIHHKNKKFKYFLFTYLILMGWIGAFMVIKFELYRLAKI